MKNSIETLKGYYFNCSKENAIFYRNGYFYSNKKEHEVPGVNPIYIYKGKASLKKHNPQGKFIGSEEISLDEIIFIEEMKFVICDKTQNSGKPYIAEDLSNTGDINSAWQFDTKEAAKKVIADSNWDWAYVESI